MVQKLYLFRLCITGRSTISPKERGKIKQIHRKSVKKQRKLKAKYVRYFLSFFSTMFLYNANNCWLIDALFIESMNINNSVNVIKTMRGLVLIS